MKRAKVSCLVLMYILPLLASAQTVRIIPFRSHYVDARNIRVWLPAGYAPGKHYAVIYLQDGQMLFDSTITWNRQEWRVDETMQRLLNARQIQNAIVVGIDNNGIKREAEFFPQAAIANITGPGQGQLQKLLPGGPMADNYLSFIVTELKPYIDKNFATYPDAKHTFIGGSSLGGLIALYGICQYPDVFSGAFCMSTHWIGTFTLNTEIPSALISYLDKYLPPARNHKLYFDHGTAGLDSLYAPAQSRVDSLVRSKGYRPRNFKSLVFKGATHAEHDWAKRLDTPLVFLLRK